MSETEHDDDLCEPDCAEADLEQTASDEAQCRVCGARRSIGDDS